MGAGDEWGREPHRVLRVRPGFSLAGFDADATPGWAAGKGAGKRRMKRRGEVLAELQEKLFAHGRTGGDRSVLLVLQGMDTAGKGGIVRHVVGMVDPQGVALTSFGVPSEEEARHHFLWRVRKALPRPGLIGVFDRSHYEDVLVPRVRGLVDPEVWQGRYEEITEFEDEVVAGGTAVIKVLLVVSPGEQAERLRRRLRRPDKHWKYDPGDIDARHLWPSYEGAYEDLLERTSTDAAPWFAVPADHKWYARLAVTELLVHTLEGLRLDWPVVDLDVDGELARLEATVPVTTTPVATTPVTTTSGD